jgi:hypothetical protein
MDCSPEYISGRSFDLSIVFLIRIWEGFTGLQGALRGFQAGKPKIVPWKSVGGQVDASFGCMKRFDLQQHRQINRFRVTGKVFSFKKRGKRWQDR